jgi:1-acyl-sn-glycerol-3-phosphate acyltransferase
MLPTGVDFLRAFLGILVAGAIPVPLYPPVRLARIEDYLRRQVGILSNAGARLLITVPEATAVARMLKGVLGSELRVTTADELTRKGEPATAVSGSASDPALIQYTSGSTGAPKGVLLDHGALLANMRAIAAHVRLKPDDVGVSWLPLYHDMGLIGTWLNCLYHGVPLALISPLSFLGQPERWLWTVHRYRGTLSAAPNFGYELCCRKIRDERLEGLSLASWRCALNGSEPVHADTVERFCRRFARFGFREEALMPGYGLAESAVALCLAPLGRPAVVDRISRRAFQTEGRAEPAAPTEASPLRFVSMGPPLPGHDVEIVDERGEPLPERRMGHLRFRGPSRMVGYFGRPDATAQATSPGGWLGTGDLAYRKDGEVFVTGRSKDLIIKAGRNLVPDEIEAAVGSVDGIRGGCVAAFGVADPEAGTERLIVVAETRATDPEELRALEAAVVRSVAEAVDLPPDRVVLVPPRSVPKTPSGKIRRGAARELYQGGRLGAPEHLSFRVALAVGRARLARWAGSAWARARRAGYLLYLALALPAAVVAIVLPGWVLALLLPGRGPALVLQRLACRLALQVARVRVSVEGLEHLPERGPIILAANHSSYLDTPVLLGHLPLDLRIVAKQEVLGWPIVGTFVRKLGHPTVDRWEFRKSVEAARAMERRLAAGEAILFFPEGTFERAAGLRPFRLGAFETAVQAGVSVVPMALRGSRRALPPGSARPRPGSIQLWIGAPIAPEGEGWPAVTGLRDRVRDAIAAHAGEPRLEIVASGPPARISTVRPAAPGGSG